ncbi:MAG: GNAT family N-acetyltransferase [Clostridia bacterium]|nr:GNAT family N-acetyltransferase [Clostridia bacterium]
MIRRAEKKDLARVNALLEQVLTVHAEGRPDIFIPGTKKYTDEELLSIFADEQSPVFVFADEEDVTRGYAFCAFEEIRNSNNMRDMKTLYIDDICVDENCRGQHIATRLYEYVKEYAKATGCDRITLNVWEVNPTARAFYDAMGMKPLKTVMEEKL